MAGGLLCNLEIHKLRLKQSCRVCGPICKEKQTEFRLKQNHEKMLEKLFDIDIDSDTEIHPENICGRCRSLSRDLEKCKRDVRKIKSLKERASSIKTFIYVAHDDNCDLCNDNSDSALEDIDTNDKSGDAAVESNKVLPVPAAITRTEIEKPSPFNYSIANFVEATQAAKPRPNTPFPETSPLLVTKTPKRRDRGRVNDIIIGTDPRSVPISQFVDPDLAATYKCSVCSVGNIARVSLTPIKANNCLHFYCPLCIDNWRSSEFVNSSSCPIPSCRKVLGEKILRHPEGLIHQIHQGLSLHCVYIQNGCSSILNLASYVQHIECCGFSMNRGRPQKKSIGLVGKRPFYSDSEK